MKYSVVCTVELHLTILLCTLVSYISLLCCVHCWATTHNLVHALLSYISLFCCVHCWATSHYFVACTVELHLTTLLWALLSYISLFCCVHCSATSHYFVVCTVELHLTINNTKTWSDTQKCFYGACVLLATTQHTYVLAYSASYFCLILTNLKFLDRLP